MTPAVRTEFLDTQNIRSSKFSEKNAGKSSDEVILEIPRCKEERIRANGLALDAVVEGMSIRQASRRYHVGRDMLRRMVEEHEGRINSNGRSNQNFFSELDEMGLVGYIQQMCEEGEKATMDKIRGLAYQYSVRYSIDVPENWTHNARAGERWAMNFVKKYPILKESKSSTRKEVATTSPNSSVSNVLTVASIDSMILALKGSPGLLCENLKSIR